jgi:hypothetical protein
VTNREKCDAVVIAVMAVAIAMAGAAVGRSLSIAGFNLAGGTSFTWYLRFRVFDITTEVLALGILAYVLPQTRLSAIAGRVAAVLAVSAIAAEIAEWSLEGRNRFLAAEGGSVATAIDHVAVLSACVAVVGMWFFALREVRPPDLA